MGFREAWGALWKQAPTAVGGGWFSVYRDNFKSRRMPTPTDLRDAYKNIVYACARLTSQGVAKTPLRLYAKRTRSTTLKSNGNWFEHDSMPVFGKRLEYMGKSPVLAPVLSSAVEIHEIADHRLQRLLSNPNPFFTRSSLIEWTMTSLDVDGNAYWAFAYDGLGLPCEIWPLEAHRVYAVPDTAGTDVIKEYIYQSIVGKFSFKPSEVLHFHMTGLVDPYIKGYSPVRAVFESSDITDKLLAYEEAVLDNRARPDMLISPKEPIGAAEALRLERKLQQKFRAGGAGGVVVGESGLDYRALVFPPSDLAALEIRKAGREEIAAAMGVPMSMLQTRDVNRANAEAGHYQHAKDAILPRCRMFEEVLNAKLIPMFYEGASDDQMFFAFDDPVPEDQENARKWRETNIKTGVRSINEERRNDGMPPIKGGESPMTLSNYVPIDMIRDMAASIIARNSAGAAPNGSPEQSEPFIPEPAREPMPDGSVEP